MQPFFFKVRHFGDQYLWLHKFRILPDGKHDRRQALFLCGFSFRSIALYPKDSFNP